MNGSAIRGWCPSLSAPMATGDGLLARLSPRGGLLSPAQLAGIAQAAQQHGNGQLEVTVRGNLQIRGLTQTSAPLFADAILALAVDPEPSPEIRVSPLIVLDGDALPAMASEIRDRLAGAGLTAALAPKFSIVIDEARRPTLARLAADIRVTALDGDRWSVAIAGDGHSATVLGEGERETVLASVTATVRAIAALGSEARARDLELTSGWGAALGLSATETAKPDAEGLIGRVALRGEALALGLALPFGQAEASDLLAFADALPTSAAICLAPGHSMLIGDLAAPDFDTASRMAADLGLIVDRDDPRLRILACAGAPACASGYLETRALARQLAGVDAPAGRPDVYIAGCSKQCAKPSAPHVAVIGGEDGVRVEDTAAIVAEPYRRYLRGLAGRFAVARSLRA